MAAAAVVVVVADEVVRVAAKHQQLPSSSSSHLVSSTLDACDQLDGGGGIQTTITTVHQQRTASSDKDFEDFTSAERLVPQETTTKGGEVEQQRDKKCEESTEQDAKDSSSKPKVGIVAADSTPQQRYVSPKDFELLKVIGMGAFGKVLQVRNKLSGQVAAMKVISKRLLKRNSGRYIENVQAERNILTRVRSPFVVTMHCSFQTSQKLFIIMDFLAGGELFLRLGKEGIFREATAAFYLAEMILALDHLHSLGILHRDLKPENVLLSADGHVCLTDFGLAKDFSGDGGFGDDDDDQRALTICGTREYMAPEMIAQKGYGRAADYWSLGCIAYEMLSGEPPFSSRQGAKDLFRKIMSERVKMPDGSTAAACKLLKGLLNRNVQARWGTAKSTMFEVGGVAGLKKADFFAKIQWTKLELKQLDPPDVFHVDNDLDLKHFHEEFKTMPLPRSVVDMVQDDFTPRRVASGTFRGFSFVQDDFLLPERDLEEIRNYWETVEEDAESASDVASSKQLDDDDDLPPITQYQQQQKQQQAKKKKKKKKKGIVASAASTPAASAAATPAATPTPSEAGDAPPTLPTLPDNNNKPVKLFVEATTKPAEPIAPAASLVQAPAPVPPPKQRQEEVWQDAAPTSKKNKRNQKGKPQQQPPKNQPAKDGRNTQPKPAAPAAAKSSYVPVGMARPGTKQPQTATRNGPAARTMAPQSPPQVRKTPQPPPPAQNWPTAAARTGQQEQRTSAAAQGWAGVAVKKQQAKPAAAQWGSAPTPIQPHRTTVVNPQGSWGAPPPVGTPEKAAAATPPPPPPGASPSSDWRQHNMSPRSLRRLRQSAAPTPTPVPAAAPPSWPTLKNNQQAAPPPALQPTSKLQGAWASRTKS